MICCVFKSADKKKNVKPENVRFENNTELIDCCCWLCYGFALSHNHNFAVKFWFSIKYFVFFRSCSDYLGFWHYFLFYILQSRHFIHEKKIAQLLKHTIWFEWTSSRQHLFMRRSTICHSSIRSFIHGERMQTHKLFYQIEWEYKTHCTHFDYAYLEWWRKKFRFSHPIHRPFDFLFLLRFVSLSLSS